MCEVSEILDVKKVVSDLKDNPVFRMSLASKELFHSNMLAWLLESRNADGLSDMAKELAKLFMPKQHCENGYKVLTVLREKNHLDLIIVFLPDNEDFKYDDWTKIEDVFQNSGSDDQNLLGKLQKNCQFVVVENKFKSIPDKEQLKKYDKTIEKGICFKTIKVAKRNKISVVLNEENTTRYLMAPEVALNSCKEELQEELQEEPQKKCRKWNPVSYEKIRYILKSKIKSDNDKDFTGKLIEHYADFLKDMLELTKDIEKKLKLPNDLAFPKQRDIAELRKIRIHDFYEKLWFSVLLNKIKTTVKGGSGYSNSSGLVEFQIPKDNVVYGVQIQQCQFRLFVLPKKCTAEYDEKIKTYCSGVLEIMKEKLGENLEFFKKHNTEELHRFGDFKYRFIPLEKDISIEKLRKMINIALDAISHQSPLKILEAEEKKPSQSAVEQKGEKK